MPTAAPDPERPVVATTEGRLRGRRHGAVTVFSGVRYASAPVGRHRFAAARPPEPWTGIRDAAVPAAACPQLPSPFATLFGDPSEPQDEDCLTLTVWTPGLDDQPRPVVVWLHGGSYITGSGTLPRYDGAELAVEENVVVVLVTYRIGVLGFPPFDDAEPVTLSDAGPDATPSTGAHPVRNVGAWDLVAALQWVRRNAAAFGGDPWSLCALGQSAGGQILASLLRLPGPSSLVRRAGLHSAPLGLEPADTDEAVSAFAARSGASSAAAARRLSVDDLLAGQADVLAAPMSRGDVRPGVRLVADGILTGRGLTRSDAPATPLPLLVATTRDECRLWFPNPDAVSMDMVVGLAEQFFDGGRASEALERYSAVGHRGGGALMAAVLTDAMFAAPSERYARTASAAQIPARLARFDTAAAGAAAGYGAAHCIDIPFLLGSPAARRMPLLAGWSDHEQAAVRREVRGQWGRFARGHADPDHGGVHTTVINGLNGAASDGSADGLLHPEVRPLWEGAAITM